MSSPVVAAAKTNDAASTSGPMVYFSQTAALAWAGGSRVASSRVTPQPSDLR